jgi:hypothetical protein
MGCIVDFPKKLPKVNNHPKGENSPNLVTLLSHRCRRESFPCS